MKLYRALAVAVTATAAIALPAGSVSSQQADHKVVPVQDIKWVPSPSLPGAEVAVLYGDPSKETLFAMRLKLPKGFVIPPHTHPKPEVVTVISGAARLGMGEKADRDKATALPAGSFFALSPGMAHYFIADGDTVVQLNSVGPWSVNYVNPADDPAKKK